MARLGSGAGSISMGQEGELTSWSSLFATSINLLRTESSFTSPSILGSLPADRASPSIFSKRGFFEDATI